MKKKTININLDIDQIYATKIESLPNSPWMRLSWNDRSEYFDKSETINIRLNDDNVLSMPAKDLEFYAAQKQARDGKFLSLESLKEAFSGPARSADFSKVDLNKNHIVVYDVESYTKKTGWIGGQDFRANGSSGSDTLGVVLEKETQVKGTFHGNGGRDTLKFAGPKKNYQIEIIEEAANNSEKHQKVTYTGSDNFHYGLEVDVYGDVELVFVAPLTYKTWESNLIDYWNQAA